MLPQDPEKLARVQSELDHLAEIFREIDPNKRDFVQRHIEQLAWYFVSIADLQAKVDQWGTLIQYNNGGGQSGVKPNPDIRTLLDYQKCCNTIVRTLIGIVPDKASTNDIAKFREMFEVDPKYEDPEYWEQEKLRDEEHQRRINEEIERAVEKQRKEREQRERASNG